jgi:hypothetical protein
VKRSAAQARAADLRPKVENLQEKGATSYNALATKLNRRGVPTVRGKTWFPASVRQVLRHASTAIESPRAA